MGPTAAIHCKPGRGAAAYVAKGHGDGPALGRMRAERGIALSQNLEEVRLCLSERLARPLDEIQPESRLFDDLGSDSLDLLDIIFTLEKRFSIKLRNSELDRLLRADFSEAQGVGELAPEDLERLAEWLPALRTAAPPVTPQMLFSFITVESLAVIVQRKLEDS